MYLLNRIKKNMWTAHIQTVTNVYGEGSVHSKRHMLHAYFML